MIINAQSIIITLIIVAIAFYFGLQFIRKFALQIAKENNDAIMQMDAAETEKLQRKLAADADRATIEAYAKVKASSAATTTGNSNLNAIV
jgi:predicted TIM-barrel enzyme